MKLTRAALAAAGIGVAACGTGQVVDQGHWQGGDAPADAGNRPPFDAGWPTVPVDAAGAPTGAPSFGGSPEAGAGAVAGACSGKGGALGDSMMTLQSSGGQRDALVHVPSSYDPTKAAMLVLNYHGFTMDSLEEEIFTGMSAQADARNFLIAYPDGIATSFNAGTCCGVSWTNSVDDVQFTKDLLAKIESEYCIDPTRVYAAGFSNGGFMAHRLGCEMADVFAAIAPVSGVLGIPPATCLPARPIPVIDFHGLADPVVPYGGGAPVFPFLGAFLQFASVPSTINFWRTANDCEADQTTIYANGDASCVDYGGCRGDAEVVACTISDGGHAWPGGVAVPLFGKTSTDISATDTIVDFFLAHPMPMYSVAAN